ncbi:aminotransferase [Xylona heveae TC161]|uniref:Aminotransferase n=1 Tax=Xylona heveae (strain CBS 132557 / TC161) TaxID=1328760 RepID=A0A165K0U0_XYLHT|nr:aminotransferase [Xylona heveae TC161]KZF26863.1 aminotransferase [Xylona heveae TC161]
MSPSRGNSSESPGLLLTFKALLERRLSNSTLRQLTISPADSVDFSSNDYLSLAPSPSFQSAFQKELAALQPTFPIGSTGSRLLDGNSSYAENLEREIAAFHNAPAALLFNSGFEANVGIFSCIPQPGDVIIYDEYIHASVHDGMRLSRAKSCKAFAHNSIADFRKVLQSFIDADPLLITGKSNVIIAVESVYSMDGDTCPLKEFVSSVESMLPAGNGYIIVDEAHSTGVFGQDGRGFVSALGMEDRIFARLHTFGKALACNGAAVLCPPLMKQYLVNYARSLIYTTSLSYPSLASIKAVYRLMKEGQINPLQSQLWATIRTFHSRLDALAKKSPPQLLRTFDEAPKSQILALLTSRPRSLAKYCQKHGYIVRAIVPPTVPAGAERVRVCLHASTTEEELEGLLQRIEEWVETKRLELEHPAEARPKAML